MPSFSSSSSLLEPPPHSHCRHSEPSQQQWVSDGNKSVNLSYEHTLSLLPTFAGAGAFNTLLQDFPSLRWSLTVRVMVSGKPGQSLGESSEKSGTLSVRDEKYIRLPWLRYECNVYGFPFLSFVEVST